MSPKFTDRISELRKRPARELLDKIPEPKPLGRRQRSKPKRKPADDQNTSPGKNPVEGLGSAENLATREAGKSRLALSSRIRPSQLSVRIDGEEWLQRRLRILARHVQLDAPTMWRLAAHTAVISLTVAVIGVTRIPGSVSSALGARDASLGVWTEGASPFLPDSFVGNTTAGSIAPFVVEGADRPGFISPGAIAEAHPSILPWSEPEEYRVVRGDSLSTIASRFGIDPEWILMANPEVRDKPHDLSVGHLLTVLPMQAVIHEVEAGETIQALAEKYETTPNEVVAYAPNGLNDIADVLAAGTRLILPGGTVEVEIPPNVRSIGRVRGSGWASPSALGTVVGSGYFHSAAYGRLTQGYHRWHRAVDIANRTGTPIFSVDSGVVKYAGWYQWAGNLVIVDHGNGYESWYAHLSSISVSSGQQVQRGQVLGGMGCTYGRGGRCTGPHLHLEIRLNGGKQNPCALGAC